AAFIDYITSDEAMELIAENGGMPVNNKADLAPDSGGNKDIYEAFHAVSTEGSLLPYLDYATPSFADTAGAARQAGLARPTHPAPRPRLRHPVLRRHRGRRPPGGHRRPDRTGCRRRGSAGGLRRIHRGRLSPMAPPLAHPSAARDPSGGAQPAREAPGGAQPTRGPSDGAQPAPVGPRPARMLSGRRPAREAAGRPSAVARSTIGPYLLILPARLVYGAFALYPLGRAAQFSLFEWRGFGSSTFVGLQNYLDLAGDADFRAAIANALVLIIFYAVIPLVVGLVLAAI